MYVCVQIIVLGFATKYFTKHNYFYIFFHRLGIKYARVDSTMFFVRLLAESCSPKYFVHYCLFDDTFAMICDAWADSRINGFIFESYFLSDLDQVRQKSYIRFLKVRNLWLSSYMEKY